MKTADSLVLIATGLMACVLPSLGAGVVPESPSALMSADIPPANTLDSSLHPVGKPVQTIEFSSTTRVNIYYSLSRMKVMTSWIWEPTEYAQGVVNSQEHAVPFRPTALQTILEQHAFCVAGVGDGGATLIERWDITAPTTRKFRQWPSGQWRYQITPGSVSAKTPLFSDPTAAEGPVNYFVTNHGTSGELFFQFLYSLNVYSIDTDSGTLTPQLSGTLFPTNLRAGFLGMREVDHPTKGYLYFLYEGASDNPRLFVMDDASKSGVLDGVLELVGDDHDALGYGEGTALNTFWEWPPF